MWFGTRDGLDRYDGYEITVFKNDPSKFHSISDNYINCLFEDSDHVLWAGTKDGLNKFDQYKNTFVKYYHDPTKRQSLSNNEIESIYSDKFNNLWVGTADGCLNFFNKKKDSLKHFFLYKTPQNVAIKTHINCLYEDNDHNFWVGTDRGLLLFDRNTHSLSSKFQPLRKYAFPIPYPIVAIQQDHEGNLWLGTERNGLVAISLKNNTVKHYVHNDQFKGSLSNDQVKCLLVDSKGNIWVGSINGGLDLFDPLSNSFIHNHNEPENPRSLSQKTASAIFEDNQHNLWVGTHRGGINLYNPQGNKFKLLQNGSDKNSLSYNDVRALVEDSDQNIWIGTDGGGLNVFYPAKNLFSVYRFDPFNRNSISSDAVLDILIDNRNEVWISTWGGGLNCLDRKNRKFRHYINDPKDKTSISSNYVAKSFIDSEGNFWIATYYGGLNLFNRKKSQFSLFTVAPDNRSMLLGKNIVSINEDKNKNLWIGTDDGGLNCYDLKTKRISHFFNAQEKLPDLRVLFIDHAGRLWLGQSGLYLFDQKERKFSIYTKKAGLGTEFIKSIREDDKFNLWISTSNGLTKFNPVSFQYKKYNTADGLQGNEFEVNSSLKTQKGLMYFGGVNGINIFNPSIIETNKSLPPVYITGLQIFNKTMNPSTEGSPLSDDISLTKAISLSYKQTSITLNFSALNYTASLNNEYAYRLLGLDSNWYYIRDRKASFTNLEPGRYEFQVRAANNDGLWNTKSTNLAIMINPPFWATWWFRIFFCLLILFISYRVLLFKKNLDLHKIEENKREEMYQLKLQFFTNISHEFRTPLSLIIGPLEVLLEQEKTNNSPNYEAMYRNANRLLLLINELMDFTKVEAGVLGLMVMPGNINSFVEELVEEFKPTAVKKNISLNFILNPNMYNRWFDRQVLEKIVMNLINNSIKYTPINGSISVEVSDNLQNFKSQFKNELILKNSFNGEKYAYIRISDTGIGISKDSIKYLFERYYRITELHLGSGIGLAFVKSLTLLHKGDIFVYSERHKGTDIIIGLPVSENDYQPNEKWAESTQVGGVRLESMSIEPSINLYSSILHDKTADVNAKYRILVVDDNEEIRLFIKSHLEKNYFVTEATDGYSGILKAKEEIPDLIISDIMMPGVNGIDFCLSIKEDINTSHIPFIMLTAKTNLQAEIEGIESGADLYLPKPLSISLLSLSIRNIFEQRKKLKERYLRHDNIEARELVHSLKDKEFMEKLLNIIHKQLSNPELNINDLCNTLCMSRTKLYLKIKNLVGQSPNEFIRSIRLKKAVEILTHEDVSLTEVMFRIGIQTQSYFSKAFKKEIGKSPTQFMQDLLTDKKRF